MNKTTAESEEKNDMTVLQNRIFNKAEMLWLKVSGTATVTLLVIQIVVKGHP